MMTCLFSICALYRMESMHKGCACISELPVFPIGADLT
ncbi:hypothetical protein SDC9_83318 [bioreactor metagenome]|jgi:hypothetical protein|uniref:Uncharacterized protein n=1 Tax=bioreactor metagenome TaxID=1076179 RepID=A0A644Z794_9ZZZZ